MVHPDTAKESSVSSIPVNFFNTRIAGHIGVAKLFRFTRATVIPMAIRWNEQNNINLDEIPKQIFFKKLNNQVIISDTGV